MTEMTGYLLRELRTSIEYENGMEVGCRHDGSTFYPAARAAYQAVLSIVEGARVEDPLATVRQLMLDVLKQPNYGGCRWEWTVAHVDDWLHEQDPARCPEGQLRVDLGFKRTSLQRA